MEDLAKHGTYVAGFLDPSVQGRSDLYDLFVNSESSPAVSPVEQLPKHRRPRDRIPPRQHVFCFENHWLLYVFPCFLNHVYT